MKKILIYTDNLDNLTNQVGELQLDIRRLAEQQNGKSSHNRLLTRMETASMLRISLSTLHRIVRNGYLPSFKVGRRTLFKEADVQKCLIQINSYYENLK